jgi:hypothetical protein
MSICKVYNMGLLLVFWLWEWRGHILQNRKFGVEKKSLVMRIELNTKMKRNQVQYARPNTRLIFNVWLWEWIGVVL